MTRTMYALEYDDGNNYYGNVELMTEDLSEVVNYIISEASRGDADGRGVPGLDGAWIKGEYEQSDLIPNVEVIKTGVHPSHSKKDDYWDGTWALVKYSGDRTDVDAMRIWLEEFTEHKFNLTSKDFE